MKEHVTIKNDSMNFLYFSVSISMISTSHCLIIEFKAKAFQLQLKL